MHADTTIRLIDFGLARAIDEDNPANTHYVMTRWYVVYHTIPYHYRSIWLEGIARPRLF